MGAIELTPLPLDWESDTPIWTPQWPLTKEKLAALMQLINEQLQKAHIEPSFSPWNHSQRDPPFVPRKRLPDWASLELSPSVESCGCGLGPSPVRLG